MQVNFIEILVYTVIIILIAFEIGRISGFNDMLKISTSTMAAILEILDDMSKDSEE